jgi:transcriptional regulator with XRE-family HTH domain
MHNRELLNHFIWEEIRKIRIQKWLSQIDLALKIHSTQSVIARIESGKSNISMKTLWKLTSGLGVRISLVV